MSCELWCDHPCSDLNGDVTSECDGCLATSRCYAGARGWPAKLSDEAADATAREAVAPPQSARTTATESRLQPSATSWTPKLPHSMSPLMKTPPPPGYTNAHSPFAQTQWIQKQPLTRRHFSEWNPDAPPVIPVIFTNMTDIASISAWRVWQDWTPEKLSRTHESFSNVGVHQKSSRARWATYAQRNKDVYGVWGSVEIPFHMRSMSTSELFKGCAAGDLLYVGGTNHPLLDAAIPQFDLFTMVPTGTHGALLYWSCPGVPAYLHYDVHSILLAQVYGHKDLFLLPPSAVKHAYLFPSSHVADRQTMLRFAPGEAALNSTRWPLLRALTTYQHHRLSPGEMIYIPVGWLHAVGVPGPGPSLGLSFKKWGHLGELTHELGELEDAIATQLALGRQSPLTDMDRTLHMIDLLHAHAQAFGNAQTASDMLRFYVANSIAPLFHPPAAAEDDDAIPPMDRQAHLALNGVDCDVIAARFVRPSVCPASDPVIEAFRSVLAAFDSSHGLHELLLSWVVERVASRAFDAMRAPYALYAAAVCLPSV
eukprot:CAMPEP_0119316674 /NCGR_PEP_ID=MMETSP1333-20130426/40397_1 /TAXON_ID=418940 /ORGANISM="Scyphosphaera apsteinii, Strain RCC1455" /LENGTH=538 /DNA_ID=CAMNT_0007322377 /DNA_START=300 /DNA_END=1916 /DNA_ORIENTATION=-